jgi:hypothetical protein
VRWLAMLGVLAAAGCVEPPRTSPRVPAGAGWELVSAHASQHGGAWILTVEIETTQRLHHCGQKFRFDLTRRARYEAMPAEQGAPAMYRAVAVNDADPLRMTLGCIPSHRGATRCRIPLRLPQQRGFTAGDYDLRVFWVDHGPLGTRRVGLLPTK